VSFYRVLRKQLTTKYWSPIRIYCVNCTGFGSWFSGISFKLLPPAVTCHILGWNIPNSISAGTPPQAPLRGTYGAPKPPSWIKGVKGRCAIHLQTNSLNLDAVWVPLPLANIKWTKEMGLGRGCLPPDWRKLRGRVVPLTEKNIIFCRRDAF